MVSIDQMQEWFTSPPVKELFEEFVQDYLINHRQDPIASYIRFTHILAAQEMHQFQQYSSITRPVKANWSIEKHWARLAIQFSGHARNNETAWKAPREKILEIWFSQAFEIIAFFVQEWLFENPSTEDVINDLSHLYHATY